MHGKILLKCTNADNRQLSPNKSVIGTPRLSVELHRLVKLLSTLLLAKCGLYTIDA